MTPLIRFLGTATVLLLAPAAHATLLEVGPGKTYPKPCNAFANAGTGDVVQIDASGNYDGDVCAISADALSITGVNGRPHIDAAGSAAQGKGTWVVQGDGITIENIELSGAAVPDHNGAAIRAEGTGLTIRNCYFHDNENGILGGAGEVLIERSEFARNGNCIDPSGCAHNMYLSNAVTKFTLRYSYTHAVTDGHLVKSRAQTNYILSNRITGESGTNSYEIDLPNAGSAYIIGNIIEQGPSSGNSTIIAYGEEGATNAGKDLYVVNNTFVNDRNSGTFVNVAGSVTTPAIVKNNIFFGPGTTVNQGNADASNNFTGNPMLVDRAGFDYHLLVGSPCIDAGTNPGASLLPVAEYVHPASFTARPTVGVIDIGAYEFPGATDGGSGTGGASNGSGGSPSTGGSSGNGGNAASGGNSGNGGNTATGGSSSNGGNAATGGNAGTGGSTGGSDASVGGGGNAPDGSAGGASAGGASGSSGTSGSGNGGRSGSGAGGASGSTSGGKPGSGGSSGGPGTGANTNDAGTAGAAAEDTGGCGCRTATRAPASHIGLFALGSVLLLARRRTRRRSSTSVG